MKYYSYILIRKDLPHSVQVVQAAHAAMEAGFVAPKPSEPVNFAVLGVENEEQLLHYAERLTKVGINFEMFFEPDDERGYTALCTYPKWDRIHELKNLRTL